MRPLIQQLVLGPGVDGKNVSRSAGNIFLSHQLEGVVVRGERHSALILFADRFLLALQHPLEDPVDQKR